MTESHNLSFPDVGQVFRTLDLGEPDDAWRQAWPASQASFPSEPLFFLDPSYVRDSCRWLRMGDDVVDACLRGLAPFKANETLRRMAWHFHFSWFRPAPDLAPTSSPPMPAAIGEEAAMLYAIVFLSGLPTIRALHREREIPEPITLDTLADLERWIRKHRERHGAWGFSEIFWLRLHFAGKIFKLGRLQFEMSRFSHDYHVYRNRRTGRVVVLAGDGMRFRADGQAADAADPGYAAAAAAWTAYFAADDRGIRGMLISPFGAGQSTPVELPAAEWRLILSKDDPALNIHIPAAGPMDHAACGESFRQAMEFFPKHFPDFSYRAFTCFSWLLDRRFEDHLAPSSNIVRFLREFYLIPVVSFGPIRSFGHIFDNFTGDLDQAPQRTSLQRATLKHLKAGGEWRVGGSLLFPEDFNWGAQVYRSQPS